MADFPTSPIVGNVYNVGGVNFICTGTGRFKPIPELSVYSDVATLKLGVVPSGHRAKAVRYTASGEPVPNLEYISRGLGWPVTADNFVNIADSKGNFLEFQLTNNTISLLQAGADKTGAADSSPMLRAAMARLKTNGGGILEIPVGTFYLNSGDPRGLKIAGTADFYTVCEIADNVTVRGFGEGSVLRYNSNRIGVVPATSKGDVGALFANFRVRAASNTPYACKNFNVENFKVEYTTLTNQTVDFIDGQVVRVYSLSGSVDNGTFYARDMNVSNFPGHQVFSYEKVAVFESNNCRFVNSGKLTNSANTDVSLYYVTGTKAHIANNYSEGSTAANDNSTFIELHTLYSTVTDNVCVGMNTFINAVSQVTHPSAFYDFSEFHINNNHARGCRNFIVDWLAPSNRKGFLEASNNTVILRAASATDVEGLLKHAVITGSSDLPTELIILDNNTVTVSISGAGATPVAYNTAFDALIRHSYVKELRINGGEYKNTRRSFIVADGVALQKLSVTNVFADFGYFGNTTDDNSGKASRSGIVVNFSSGNAVQRVTIEDNVLTGRYGGALANHGIFTLNSAGVATAVMSIKGNDVYSVAGEELGAVVFAGNSHASDSITIKHVAKNNVGTALAGMFPDVGIASITEGSYVNRGTNKVVVANTGGSKDFIVYGKGTAAPTAGYYSEGSFVQNTRAGVLGWKCESSGSPGTWVAKA